MAQGDRGCRQVVIDPDGGWNEPTATADLIARVDPSRSARRLRGAARAPRGPRLAEGVAARPAAAEAEVDAFLNGLGDELFEPRVHRDLGALLPGGSTVYVASSMPIRDLETFLPTTGRRCASSRTAVRTASTAWSRRDSARRRSRRGARSC